jgi:hypothetical protein
MLSVLELICLRGAVERGRSVNQGSQIRNSLMRNGSGQHILARQKHIQQKRIRIRRNAAYLVGTLTTHIRIRLWCCMNNVPCPLYIN